MNNRDRDEKEKWWLKEIIGKQKQESEERTIYCYGVNNGPHNYLTA